MSPRGRVVTFYSYKGGVGRTFLVANVAALLARWGYKVLCIDWDLEAPGLPEYFRPWLNNAVLEAAAPIDSVLATVGSVPRTKSLPLPHDDVGSGRAALAYGRGLLEVIEAFGAGRALDWHEHITAVNLPETLGHLDLMTAGRNDDTYAARVQKISWADLYSDRDLGGYLESLRLEFISEYDIILVDSRTGITDIGGICTAQLPDLLVLCFTTSYQSLNGAIDIAGRAIDARNRLPYGRGGLLVLPVACRVDGRDEYERAQTWRSLMATRLAPFYSSWMASRLQPIDMIERTTIPYFSYWSFGEAVATIGERTTNPDSISYPIEAVAALVGRNLDSAEQLVDRREDYILSAHRSSLSPGESTVAGLYSLLDSLHPLDHREVDLYVDWHRELGATDLKAVLLNSIARTAGPRSFPISGHRGSGKTTELNQLRYRLQSGAKGTRIFVSQVFAEQWLDLEDVRAEDVAYSIGRQLVNDLADAGFNLPRSMFGSFLAQLTNRLGSGTVSDEEGSGERSRSILPGPDTPLSACRQVRALLEEDLPSLYDLLNNAILPEAREWLAHPAHGGYGDLIVILDQLDRIPRSLLTNARTNHERLFIDQAADLRALNCHLILTLPIELVVGQSRSRLEDVYGSAVLTLSAIPVADRQGGRFGPGLRMLRTIVERRVERAGFQVMDVFESEAGLDQLLFHSGGLIRSVFVLLNSLLNRTDALPVKDVAVKESLVRAARDRALGLGSADWEVLNAVHYSKAPLADNPVWAMLLAAGQVLLYQDDLGYWYDMHPLLHLVADQ